MKERLNQIEDKYENNDIRDKVSVLEHRANTQEDYSRKINLIFEGIPEKTWEKSEQTEEIISKFNNLSRFCES